MDHRLEDAGRVVVGLGLDVLGQADEGRAAGGRIEHRRDRVGERVDHLLGRDDAIQ